MMACSFSSMDVELIGDSKRRSRLSNGIKKTREVSTMVYKDMKVYKTKEKQLVRSGGIQQRECREQRNGLKDLDTDFRISDRDEQDSVSTLVDDDPKCASSNDYSCQNGHHNQECSNPSGTETMTNGYNNDDDSFVLYKNAKLVHKNGFITCKCKFSVKCEKCHINGITVNIHSQTRSEKAETIKGANSFSSLHGLDVQKLDGVNYFGFSLDLHYNISLMREVDIKTDDVITIGFPRSGNHWTFEVVNMILQQSLTFSGEHFYSRLLEFLGDYLESRLALISSPRNLTSHCRFNQIPKQAIEKRVKVIYVLRNPKDVLVSLYNFTTNLSNASSCYKGSWEEFFDLQMRGEFPWGYWFDHVLGTEEFMKTYPQCPLHVLVFEKLKQDPVSEIYRLCQFLDKPVTLATQIAEATEFNQMKHVLGKTKLLEQSERHFQNGPDAILRKGVIGDWKSWFTVAQNEQFDALFEEFMAGSVLGEMMRPYIMT